MSHVLTTGQTVSQTNYASGVGIAHSITRSGSTTSSEAQVAIKGIPSFQVRSTAMAAIGSSKGFAVIQNPVAGGSAASRAQSVFLTRSYR